MTKPIDMAHIVNTFEYYDARAILHDRVTYAIESVIATHIRADVDGPVCQAIAEELDT